jgi:hypothetical protein
MVPGPGGNNNNLNNPQPPPVDVQNQDIAFVIQQLWTYIHAGQAVAIPQNPAMINAILAHPNGTGLAVHFHYIVQGNQPGQQNQPRQP